MKRIKILFLGVLSFIICNGFSQNTITLQPDSTLGKDALIESFCPNKNYKNHPNIQAEAWTEGGVPGIDRSLFAFDLSQLPSEIIVNSALLSLYYAPQYNGLTHSTLSGSNECIIQRIINSWDESTVTWNNQPSTTSVNQVTLPQSSFDSQDYLNIDVTSLVKDMLDSNEIMNMGFMISLVTEVHYRRMSFASSDYVNSSKHPKLVINYISTIGVQNTEKDLTEFVKIYPNPFSDYATIEFDNPNNENYNLKLYNIQGQLAKAITGITTGKTKLSKDNLKSGLYFLQISSEGQLLGEGKLIIE